MGVVDQVTHVATSGQSDIKSSKIAFVSTSHLRDVVSVSTSVPSPRGTLTSAVILRLRYCGKYCNYCGKSNSKFGRKNSDEKILTKKFRRKFFMSMSTSILRPCRPQFQGQGMVAARGGGAVKLLLRNRSNAVRPEGTSRLDVRRLFVGVRRTSSGHLIGA